MGPTVGNHLKSIRLFCEKADLQSPEKRYRGRYREQIMFRLWIFTIKEKERPWNARMDTKDSIYHQYNGGIIWCGRSSFI
jgi:hypothetical protein